MKQADTKTWRFAFYLLAPLLLFGLTAAIGADEPKAEKTPGTVEVRLSEYAIDMPETLAAGPTTFVVLNQGNKTHSFKIEGPGIDELLSAPVAPRAKGSLQVTLQAGEYKVYCPVGSHSSKGMARKLVVTAKKEG
jgi:uncharacterized cupredoxin-like copper-binding protein